MEHAVLVNLLRVSALFLAASATACSSTGNGGSNGPGGPGGGGPSGGIVIGAPAAGSYGTNVQPLLWSTGKNLTTGTHATGTYPLLQSVMRITSTGLSADNAAIAGGATLTALQGGISEPRPWRLQIPGLGIDYMFHTWDLLTSSSNSSGAGFSLVWANADYLALGLWQLTPPTDASSPTHIAFFVTGFQTPGSSMPATGTAAYSETDNVVGAVFHPDGGATIAGDASFAVNFATGTVAGTFTNMKAIEANNTTTTPWNNVGMNGSIMTGTNGFTGATAVSSAPSGVHAMRSGATGTIIGSFFGPAAAELGAIWTLSDGRAGALGAVAAPKGP
jgi:hypothetical protein